MSHSEAHLDAWARTIEVYHTECSQLANGQNWFKISTNGWTNHYHGETKVIYLLFVSFSRDTVVSEHTFSKLFQLKLIPIRSKMLKMSSSIVQVLKKRTGYIVFELWCHRNLIWIWRWSRWKLGCLKHEKINAWTAAVPKKL